MDYTRAMTEADKKDNLWDAVKSKKKKRMNAVTDRMKSGDLVRLW